MAELLSNLATTTLGAAISTTPAALTSENWLVASTAAPFPQTGNFRATIGPVSDLTPEIVLVTAVNDATHFQVQRGVESSTIKTHANADAFQATLTVAALRAAVVMPDQANTFTTGAQDLGAATSLIVPKAAGAVPTAVGDLRYDTTKEAFVGGGHGALTAAIPRVLSVQRSTTDSLTNSATSEQNFATTFSLPANFLTAQKTVRVTAVLGVTSPASPTTEVWRLKFGSVVLYAAATTTPIASLTNQGASLTWILQGTAAAGASVGVETGIIGILANAGQRNTTAQPVLCATNGALVITISMQFGATGSNQTDTLRQLFVEELN